MKFLANPETEEVFSKIKLVPLGNRNIGELDFKDDGVVGVNGFENLEKPASFAKAFAQSEKANFCKRFFKSKSWSFRDFDERERERERE